MNSEFEDILYYKRFSLFEAIDYFYYAGYPLETVMMNLSERYSFYIETHRLFDIQKFNPLCLYILNQCELFVDGMTFRNPDLIYWRKNNAIMMVQDVKKRILSISYNHLKGLDLAYCFNGDELIDLLTRLDKTFSNYKVQIADGYGRTIPNSNTINQFSPPFKNREIGLNNYYQDKLARELMNTKIDISHLDKIFIKEFLKK